MAGLSLRWRRQHVGLILEMASMKKKTDATWDTENDRIFPETQMMIDNHKPEISKVSVFHIEAENVSQECIKAIIDSLSCHLQGIDRIR